MKLLFLFIIFSFTLSSCHKYSDDVDLSNDIILGNSIFFLYGEEQASNWRKYFIVNSKTSNVELLLDKEEDIIYSGLLFNKFNLNKVGFLDIHNDRNSFTKGVVCTVNLTVDEDLKGYEYELHNEDKNYFELIKVDTIEKVIDFRFRVHFKCVDKNDNEDLGWPKYLKFEGHFHEHYE